MNHTHYTFTLTIAQTNLVLDALTYRPIRDALSVLQEMEKQAIEQQKQKPTPLAAVPSEVTA